jgi:hypothetical protein
MSVNVDRAFVRLPGDAGELGRELINPMPRHGVRPSNG